MARLTTAPGGRSSSRPEKSANRKAPRKSLDKAQAKPTLISTPQPDWHAIDLPSIETPAITKPVAPELLEKLKTHALALLQDESSTYAATQLRASSSYHFMSTIMSSGTWNDKVSALTLVVQESPIHTSKSFDTLLNLAGKRSRSQALIALSALKDLLAQGLVLPASRKLRTFNKQPALLAALQSVKSTWTADDDLPNGLQAIHLIHWAFEDWLKTKFFDMLKILESWCNDEVEFARLRAVTMVWELLKDKPEQEENLLRLLVNKVGDTSKKVASRASHLLLQLQTTHPSMKSVIVDSVENEILLRPGQSSHAKYYAMITLNQTILQTSDPEVANKLLDVYFGLFVTVLNKSKNTPTVKADAANKSELKQDVLETEEPSKKRKRPHVAQESNSDLAERELEDKIIAQVLTGINRAFPFAKQDGGVFEKHLDTMFRITHSANFNTSVQALMLIQQISTAHHLSTDRFMRTLYESLLDPRLLKSSKQTLYLNLLYRSLKTDASVRRVKSFVKRLLQIITLHDPSFICAVLFLIAELQEIFPGVKAMLNQPEALDEDHDEPSDRLQENGDAAGGIAQVSRSQLYDGRKRDPEHSNADQTCLWELSPWTSHYHPSITLFASHLIHPDATRKPPKPDPTTHTLSHFLDRFVYRNPKARPTDAPRGQSLMQPALSSTGTTDHLVSARGATEQPLNSEVFWRRKVEEIRPDEVFFHRYFADVGPRKVNPEKKKRAGDDVADGVDSEVDEEEIWKALVGSRPDLEASDDEAADMDDDETDGVASDMESDGGVDVEGAFDDLAGDVGDFDEMSDEDDVNSDAADAEDDDAFDLEDGDPEALFSSEDDEPEIASKPPTREELLGVKGDGKGKKRRKLKDLPTFASAEDYAKLVDQDDDEDY